MADDNPTLLDLVYDVHALELVLAEFIAGEFAKGPDPQGAARDLADRVNATIDRFREPPTPAMAQMLERNRLKVDQLLGLIGAAVRARGPG